MKFYPAILGLLAIILATLFVAGCPRRKDNDPRAESAGRFLGRHDHNQRDGDQSFLIQQYWNAAWRIEADVRLDEFQDKTLKGVALVNFFSWELPDTIMRQIDDIQSRQWDKFAEFNLELTGTISDKVYELKTTRLPMSISDPRNPNAMIDFWDFLFPTDIQGQWPSDGSRAMEGEKYPSSGKRHHRDHENGGLSRVGS